MYKFIFLLLLLLLGANGAMAWHSWKKSSEGPGACRQLTCGLQQEKHSKGILIMPGTLVVIN